MGPQPVRRRSKRGSISKRAFAFIQKLSWRPCRFLRYQRMSSFVQVLQLVWFAIPVLRVGWRILLFRDHRPFFSQFSIEFKELLLIRRQIILGEDSLRRHSGSHSVQSMHSSGSITRKFGPSWKQSTGQTSTQSVYLHLIQFSVTTKVMNAISQPETEWALS